MKRFIATKDLFLVKNLFFFKYNKYLEFVTKEGKVYQIYGFVLVNNKISTYIRLYTIPDLSMSFNSYSTEGRNSTSIRLYECSKYEQVFFTNLPDDYNVTKKCLDAIYEFIENKIIQYDVEER